MNKKPEVIAIIPARGGSKGIPRKNISNLAGKPLIAYSILAARKSKLIDRVIVSTEDDEIAEVAVKWGAEVPFLRPKKIAGDKASVGAAINYTISKLNGLNTERAWVELYPTSPFRTPCFIDGLIKILLSGYSSVSTVKQINFDRHFLFVEDQNHQLTNITFGPDMIPVWKKYYRPYSILFARWQQKQEKHYFHVVSDKCMLIDIDTPNDLRWANAVIEKKLFDFQF